jgi:hypothetical protein
MPWIVTVPKQGRSAGIGLAARRLTLAACSGKSGNDGPKEHAQRRQERSAIRLNAIGRRSREKAVLTFRCAGAYRGSWSAACIGAAVGLSVMTSVITWTSAHAQGVSSGGCVGSWNSFSCVRRWGPAGDPFVRLVPQSLNAAERARAMQRDRQWVDRCRPVIRRDRYGVARYHYSLPGCEFGAGAY